MTATPQRLLIRGVNWLGDAVMTTPALRRLRECLPRTHIALLTHAKLADLWRHHPDLDQVIAFQAGEGPLALGRRLRDLAFDTALVLPNSPRSALEAWAAHIPRRIGLARPWRNLLLTERLPPPPGEVRMDKASAREIQRRLAQPAPRPAPPASAHQIHHYLHLAATLGASPEPVAPRLGVLDHEVTAIRERFGAPAGAPLFGLNAGAEYGPAKRWPADHFIATARQVRAVTGCLWWVFGGPADVPVARAITDALNQADPGAARCLAGETSLRELCAALRACQAVLTNDTGPMHVAAAVGTPVVVPFGSTSPELTGPGLPGDPRHRLLRAHAPCAPCFLRSCPIDSRCLTGITPAHATAALLDVLRPGA
ncbi:MAG: lipopolysaccharide heptosyltransferase [Verrucomicrobiota bacterium]|jgi:heptosyltransferase-2